MLKSLSFNNHLCNSGRKEKLHDFKQSNLEPLWDISFLASAEGNEGLFEQTVGVCSDVSGRIRMLIPWVCEVCNMWWLHNIWWFAVIAVLSIIAPVWQFLCLGQLLWPLWHPASLEWGPRVKHECPRCSETLRRAGLWVCFRQEGLALSLHHSERSQLSYLTLQCSDSHTCREYSVKLLYHMCYANF